jgi:hypothetical protein
MRWSQSAPRHLRRAARGRAACGQSDARWRESTEDSSILLFVGIYLHRAQLLRHRDASTSYGWALPSTSHDALLVMAIQPIQRRRQTIATWKDSEHICGPSEPESKATIVIDDNDLSAPVLIAKRLIACFGSWDVRSVMLRQSRAWPGHQQGDHLVLRRFPDGCTWTRSISCCWRVPQRSKRRSALAAGTTVADRLAAPESHKLAFMPSVVPARCHSLASQRFRD